jgi:competence protein ComEA
MMKKLLLALVASLALTQLAYAEVDVNKADAAALDAVAGIGPKMSQAILAERSKGGPFKDWNDLQARVKGVGPKNALRLSAAGLVVAGKGMEGAPATAKAAGKAGQGKM